MPLAEKRAKGRDLWGWRPSSHHDHDPKRSTAWATKAARRTKTSSRSRRPRRRTTRPKRPRRSDRSHPSPATDRRPQPRGGRSQGGKIAGAEGLVRTGAPGVGHLEHALGTGVSEATLLVLGVCFANEAVELSLDHLARALLRSVGLDEHVGHHDGDDAVGCGVRHLLDHGFWRGVAVPILAAVAERLAGGEDSPGEIATAGQGVFVHVRSHLTLVLHADVVLVAALRRSGAMGVFGLVVLRQPRRQQLAHARAGGARARDAAAREEAQGEAQASLARMALALACSSSSSASTAAAESSSRGSRRCSSTAAAEPPNHRDHFSSDFEGAGSSSPNSRPAQRVPMQRMTHIRSSDWQPQLESASSLMAGTRA